MLKYNLQENSDKCSRTLRSVYQYYRGESTLDITSTNFDFINENTNDSIKFKEKITEKKGNGGTKIVEIMALLKYLKKYCKNPWNATNQSWTKSYKKSL